MASIALFVEVLQGLEIVRLVLNPRPATVVVVPGTTGATSLSAAPDGSGFYFTLAGDPQVHSSQHHEAVCRTRFMISDRLGGPRRGLGAGRHPRRNDR